MKPVFFPTPARWRAWLARHHASKTEVLVGFHKRHTGTPCITWPESVDEALCFGWIDGIRRSLDADRYTIRFTPRKPTSSWSAVNIRRVAELEKAGRMTAAGRRAFAARRQSRSAIYAYEQDRKTATLTADQLRAFRARKQAWEFYRTRPQWYRRTTAWWVISAKKPETRERRLARLIAESAAGRTVLELRRSGAGS